MKKLLIFWFLILTGATGVQAQAKQVHAGFVLGSPTGLTAKYWLSADEAVEGTVSWDTSNRKNRFHMNLTWLKHKFNFIDLVNNPLAFYYGVGGKVISSDELSGGIRGAFGLGYYFKSLPVDVSLEISPVFYLIPSSTFSADLGLGFRYHF